MPAVEEDLEPPDGLAAESLPAGWREQLSFRYGHAARTVLRVAAEDPQLARPIVAGRPDLLAEAAVSARLEQARSVADVLLRRTRLGVLAARALRTAAAARPVAAALGAELGWGAQRVDLEAERWVRELQSEGIDPARALT
jgi:glycerol-3-phosphate dehydrogenase